MSSTTTNKESKTISPPLIPNETSSVCFTRRNLFDIFIAILLAIIIIYIVVQWRKSKKLEEAFSGFSEVVSTRVSAPPMPQMPQIPANVAPGLPEGPRQDMIGGGSGLIFKLFRKWFK